MVLIAKCFSHSSTNPKAESASIALVQWSISRLECSLISIALVESVRLARGLGEGERVFKDAVSLDVVVVVEAGGEG